MSGLSLRQSGQEETETAQMEQKQRNSAAKFVPIVFNDAVRSSDYTAQNARIVDNELKRWKETVLSYFRLSYMDETSGQNIGLPA
jgi:hypothetical protein